MVAPLVRMPVKPASFQPRGDEQEQQRAYERSRGSARERGYSPSWDKASKAFIASHPVCLGCEAIGLVEPATLTDHVEPHNGDRLKFWCEANWQPSCKWHHDAIKQQLEVLYGVGKAKLSDLWLNSALAIEMTRLQRRQG